MTQTIIPVILCGGSGTRLWPASRENKPKQFLSLVDENSLLQNTARRALKIAGCGADKLVTVTLATLAGEVEAQLSEIDPAAAEHILCEPSARNTSAAVAFAAAYIAETFGPECFMWILPADHHIGDEAALTDAVMHAREAAKEGYLTTFGIKPHRPETGYGYIRTGQKFGWGPVHQVDSFVEKPDIDTAKAFLEAKTYLWNSGMFFFEVAALLQEYEMHASSTLRAIEEAIRQSGTKREAAGHIYAEIADLPFDKSIMEKSARVSVVPCDPAWSDIGSWESLWEMHPKDADGNVLQGRAACHDTKNCLIQANSRMVACAGVENIVIIDTPDALLVADRSNADAMRMLVKALKKAGCLEMLGEQGWQGSVTPLHPEQQNMRGAA